MLNHQSTCLSYINQTIPLLAAVSLRKLPEKMVAAIVSKTVDEQYSCVCDTGHVMHGL